VASGLVALGVVVLVLCAALTSWPRATTEALTADLHYRVATTNATIRDLQSSIDAQAGFGGNFIGLPGQTRPSLWTTIPKALGKIHTQMPASIQALTSAGRYVGEINGSGGGIPASGPPHQPPHYGYMTTLEADPQLRSDAVLVDGSWPRGSTAFDNGGALPVVMTAKAASFLGWKVGQTQSLAGEGQAPELVKLVGTVKPRHPESDYWQLNTVRSEASKQGTPDGTGFVVHSLMWFDASAWDDVNFDFVGSSVSSWYPVRGRSLTVGNVSTTMGDLQRFLAVSRTVGQASDNIQARFSTRLTTVTDAYLDRASPASAVLSVIGTGPLGTGFAVVLLGVILLIDRRRPVLALLRARGGSERRLRATIAGETALGTVPGAILGGVAALLITPGPVDLALIATIAACAIVPVAAAVVRIEVTRVRVGRGRAGRLGPLRWVFELVVLLLAVLSVTLIFQRSQGGGAATLGVDPLMTLAPILVVAVICLALLRVYPMVMRAIGRTLRRGRGATGYVGWASVARTPARFLSIFAVIAGVSVTIFSFTILATERAGIESSELQQVGADISITAAPVPSGAQAKLRELAGVERVATVYAVGGVSFSDNDESLSLYSVDAKDLAAVQAALPASLREFSSLGLHSGGRATIIAGGFQTKPPTTTAVEGPPAIPVRVVQFASQTPPFINNPPWILMDTKDAPKGPAYTPEPIAVLIQVRPGSDTSSELATMKKILGPSALLVDTAEMVRASKTAPIVSGFEELTALALGFSALMCAIALIVTLVLGTEVRIRLLSRLRALGFGASQASGLIAWELGPLTILGIVAGLAIGLALPPVLLTAIDFAGFTGSVSNPEIILNPLVLAATIVGFFAVAAIATEFAILGARRARIATILRIPGED
jgi:putative ABC transport system permease protein